jgi:hypothetical protein
MQKQRFQNAPANATTFVKRDISFDNNFLNRKKTGRYVYDYFKHNQRTIDVSLPNMGLKSDGNRSPDQTVSSPIRIFQKSQLGFESQRQAFPQSLKDSIIVGKRKGPIGPIVNTNLRNATSLAISPARQRQTSKVSHLSKAHPFRQTG